MLQMYSSGLDYKIYQTPEYPIISFEFIIKKCTDDAITANLPKEGHLLKPTLCVRRAIIRGTYRRPKLTLTELGDERSVEPTDMGFMKAWARRKETGNKVL